MGVCLLPFPFYLLQALPAIWMSYIGIGFFYCSPVGIILVGIFPEDKEVPHLIAAVLAFGGILIALMLLLYPIFISSLNKIIVGILIGLLLIAIPLTISQVKTGRSYVPDKRIDKLIYNINFWEWMQFLSLEVLIFSIFINLLIL